MSLLKHSIFCIIVRIADQHRVLLMIGCQYISSRSYILPEDHSLIFKAPMRLYIKICPNCIRDPPVKGHLYPKRWKRTVFRPNRTKKITGTVILHLKDVRHGVYDVQNLKTHPKNAFVQIWMVVFLRYFRCSEDGRLKEVVRHLELFLLYGLSYFKASNG